MTISLYEHWIFGSRWTGEGKLGMAHLRVTYRFMFFMFFILFPSFLSVFSVFVFSVFLLIAGVWPPTGKRA